MNAANLQLSPEEIALVMNPDWILTKNSVMNKVILLFAGLGEEWRRRWAAGHDQPPSGLHPIPESISRGPKISRGENYLGLPYVMLDYPRVFGKEDILAIRTMFWWGHSFTMTLHLKGRYRNLFLSVIRERRDELEALGFHVGISGDEWRHEHAPDTYRPLADVSDLSAGTSFLKLSAAWELARWQEAASGLTGLYAALTGVLLRPAGGR
jgi:hypothetical protein